MGRLGRFKSYVCLLTKSDQVKKTCKTDNGEKKIGSGAVARCTLKYLHPSKLIRDKFPNRTASQKISELLVVRQDMKKFN